MTAEHKLRHHVQKRRCNRIWQDISAQQGFQQDTSGRFSRWYEKRQSTNDQLTSSLADITSRPTGEGLAAQSSNTESGFKLHPNLQTETVEKKSKNLFHSPVLAKQQRRSSSSSQKIIVIDEYTDVFLLLNAYAEAELTVGIQSVCGVDTVQLPPSAALSSVLLSLLVSPFFLVHVHC